MSNLNEKDLKWNKVIAVIALVLPLVVALLYYMPKSGEAGEMVRAIPFFNAIVNGCTFLLISAGIVAIKTGKQTLHRYFMMSAMVMSVIFLLGYVAYHAQVESTPFGGEGIIRTIYFAILISHIVLAAIIAPLVLVTVYRAVSGDLEKHKKMARITYPIWLYVSITGIIVYLMISPYY